MKRVDVKTGFLCNNNCIFCVQAHKKEFGNRSKEDIKKDIEDSKKNGCDEVVFTGGEFTIRDDALEIISYAKKIGYKVIQLQSNGRRLYYKDFCRKVIESGANQFALALHGSREELHDSLTKSPGSFKQTVGAIKNLKGMGQQVLMNTVVVNQNYKDLPDLARLFVDLKVDQFQVAFVHAMGNAWENIDKILPMKKDVAPYMKEAIKIGIDNGVRVMAEAMPFCMMKGYENYVAELRIPQTEVRDVDGFVSDFIDIKKREGKMKFSQCSECVFDNICEGPWIEYPQKFGSDEFVPVKDFDFQNNVIMQRAFEQAKHRPLDGPKHDYSCRIHYQDFISVKEDLRAAFKMIIPLEDFEKVKDYLKKERILSRHSDFKYIFDKERDAGLRVSLDDHRRGGVTIYAAKSEEMLDSLQKADRNSDDIKVGKILGYPDCCCNVYENSSREDHYLDSIKNTKEYFDWRLNNFVQSPNFFLVMHYPCSYECGESIRDAERLLEVIEKNQPKFAEQLKAYMKRPVLYSNYSAIIFDGYVRKNMVFYKSFHVNSLSNGCPIKFNLELFKKSNALRVSEDYIEFFNNSRLVHKYKKEDRYDGILIDFKENSEDNDLIKFAQKNELEGQIPEFIAIKENIKDNMRCVVPLGSFNEIKRFFTKEGFYVSKSDFSLKIFEDTSFQRVFGECEQDSLVFVYICRYERDMNRLIKLDNTGDLSVSRDVGEILGYPDCCINFYMKHSSEKEPHPDFTLLSLKNTKEKNSYLLNNLYWDNENQTLNNTYNYLISHFPCSFECEKSKYIAKKVLESIKKYDLNIAEDIEKNLKKTVEYKNKTELRFLEKESDKKGGVLIEFS